MIATSNMGYGGAERRVSILCNFLAEQSLEVSLSYTGNNRRPSVYELNDRVNEFYITKPWMIKTRKFLEKINPSGGILFILRRIILRREIKRTKPDIIVTFMPNSARVMKTALKGIDIPVILSIANDIEHRSKEYIDNYRTTLNNISGIVFQTKAQQKQYNDIFSIAPNVKQTVINNPAWESNYWYKERLNNKNEIISVGRLIPAKNYQLLILAFSKIAEKYNDWILTIYGEGDLRQELENQISELGLTNRAFLKGTANDIDKKLFESSIFVLSSEFEGLPNALIEAMCMGLPSVVTDFNGGGAQELITNNLNGIIVPNHNEQKLAEAISYLIENSEVAKKLGENAKYLRERLSPIIILTKWLDFFKEFS